MEVQQLSTVAGSGSNQRDMPFAAATTGGRPILVDEDIGERRQNANRNYIEAADEGTGGYVQSH